MQRFGRFRTRTGLAIGLIALVTCDGLDNVAVTETATATIPRGSLVDQLAGDIGFQELSTFDLAGSQELQNQGVERHQIDSVRVTRLGLDVLSPAGQDLAFLDSLEFYVSAEGLDRRRIAHIENIPAGTTEVDLQLDDVDLADYASAAAMKIDTEVTGRPPQQETQLEVTLELLVDVNVGGVVCGE